MRGSSSLRAFSAGILISAATLWSVQYFEKKQLLLKENAQTNLTPDAVDQYLAEKGFVAVSKRQYEQLRVNQEKNEEKRGNITEAPAPSSPKSVTIKIEKGTTAKDVALLLEKQSIIEDALSFENYLLSTQQTRKLRIGTYKLKEDMTLQEIGDILTKQVLP